jgi:hypothetical protein
MTGILAGQMAALLLTLVSIGAADAVWRRARISRRFHSLWVSLSMAAMGLPVLIWIAAIFVGPGALGRSLVGIVAAVVFVALYRNMQAQPAPRPLGASVPPPAPPAAKAHPPAQRLTSREP